MRRKQTVGGYRRDYANVLSPVTGEGKSLAAYITVFNYPQPPYNGKHVVLQTLEKSVAILNTLFRDVIRVIRNRCVAHWEKHRLHIRENVILRSRINLSIQSTLKGFIE